MSAISKQAAEKVALTTPDVNGLLLAALIRLVAIGRLVVVSPSPDQDDDNAAFQQINEYVGAMQNARAAIAAATGATA